MFCSLMLGMIGIRNYHMPAELISTPPDLGAKLILQMGPTQAQVLLQYLASEENREYFYFWEEVEIPLALLLGLSLLLATQKRILPLVLCGIMLAMVLFQFFAVTPELAYSGRRIDFPPFNEAPGAQARIWALNQVYIGAEIVKLAVGFILAGYIFIFRPQRQSRRKSDHTALPNPVSLEK